MKKQKPRLQQSYGEPKRFVTIKLPVRIVEALDTVAAYDNVTRSYIIADILDSYVERVNIEYMKGAMKTRYVKYK